MLTDKEVRALKPRADRDYMVCDAKGLYIRVQKSGRKSWIFRRQGPHAVKITLGVFPAMSLYDARRARDEAAGAVSREADDLQQSISFKDLAERYLDAKPRRAFAKKTLERLEYRLEHYIYPSIGDTPVSDLTSPLIYSSIAAPIEHSLHAELVHRLVGIVGQVLRYGIPLGLVPQGDITRDLRGSLPSLQSKPRAHLEKPAEVGALMRKIESLPFSMTKAGLLLQAYTFVRPGELRSALWSEIDLDSATWRIPAEKMKMNRPHIVPLSRQALDIMKQLKRSISAGSPYVLHALRSATKPLSDSTLLSALRDLGYTAEQMSVHGFRSIASTLLNETGWPPDAIEAQLAHDTGGSVRAVYNYAQYMDIRKLMIQWYADYLDSLAKGEPIPEKPKLR